MAELHKLKKAELVQELQTQYGHVRALQERLAARHAELDALKTEAERSKKFAELQEKTLAKVREEFDTVVNEFENRQHIHRAGNTPERLRGVLQSYDNWVRCLVRNLEAYGDDVAVYLRSIAILLDTVANASSHSEKNARLRGVMEHIESSVDQLRRKQWDYENPGWNEYPNLFRSEYPYRYYQNKIDAQQQEIQELKAAAKTEETTNNTTDELPY